MSGCEATDDVKRIIRAMAAAKVEEGVTDPHDIIDQIHDAIAEHTPLWKNEIADIISGYGKKADRAPSRTELQERILQLKRDLKEAYHPKPTPKTPEERKNATRQTQIKKEIADLQQRLKTGNFAKEPRKGFQYDPVTEKLQAQLERARREVDREMRKQEYANRSTPAKVADTFLAFHRAMILSGLGTLEHLSGASLSRLVFTPIEDVAGGLLHHIPGIKAISEAAPTEGGGFNADALGQAYGKTFSKATLRDMTDKVTRGFSDLQAVMKDPYDSNHRLLDMVGHIHDALKTPAENFAYTKALVNQAHQMRAKLAREGLSPADIDKAMADPAVIASAQANAYEAALRAKLQGNNKLVDGYRAMMRIIENGGPGGKVIAGIANYMLPIVKIPVNLADEVASYAAGEFRAAGSAYLHRGQKIEPEIADYIMRNLKKGLVGKVLMAIAWVGAGAFGAMYDEQRRKKPGEPDYGEVRIDGHTIPKELLHNPALSLMQATALARRVYDQRIAQEQRKHENVDRAGASVESAGHATEAILQTIPFIDEPMDFWKGITNPGDYAGRKVAENIPQAAKDVAKWTDPEKALGRKPKGFVQQIENVVPGLRENVPTKGLKGMSLDDKLDAYDKMSPAEREKTGIVESIQSTAEHSRTITPDQQKRVDAIQ